MLKGRGHKHHNRPEIGGDGYRADAYSVVRDIVVIPWR